MSVNDVESGVWLMEEGLVDALQVSYNLLAPEVGQALFPIAEAQKVGILVRIPMAQGILTGKFRPGEEVEEGHRCSDWPAARWRAGSKRPRTTGSWPRAVVVRSASLRYAMPSVRARCRRRFPVRATFEQLALNIAASNGVGLPAADLAAVAAIQEEENDKPRDA